MNMMNVFEEYEAELQAKGDAMVASGEWDRKMEEMRKKSEEEWARMIANGAIQTEPDEEDEDEDEDEEGQE